MPARPTAVFVYGTLLPGDVRWPVLEPFAGDATEVEVPDALFDTGHGYPAAVFGTGRGVIGQRIELDPDRLVEALAVLDEAEAVEHGLYVRIVIDTMAGPAWAYEYRGGIDHLEPLGPSWNDRS